MLHGLGDIQKLWQDWKKAPQGPRSALEQAGRAGEVSGTVLQNAPCSVSCLLTWQCLLLLKKAEKATSTPLSQPPAQGLGC